MSRPGLFLPDPALDTKVCTKCGTRCSIGDFHRDVRGILGRVSACRKCARISMRRISLRTLERNRLLPPALGVATCAGCSRELKTSEFSPNLYAKRGRQSSCRDCRRKQMPRWARKHLYGMSEDLFTATMAAQGNACAICRDHFSDANTPHVDHSHATGKIRGLLCEACNLGIGKMKDSARVLKNAVAYLENSE